MVASPMLSVWMQMASYHMVASPLHVGQDVEGSLPSAVFLVHVGRDVEGSLPSAVFLVHFGQDV